MAEHAMRLQVMTQDDAAAQRRDGGEPSAPKIRIAPVMTAIDDLDADRAGIDVLLAGPEADAGMPGPLGFRYRLHDATVFEHNIMRRDIGARGAEARDRTFRIGHAG